jgi:O-antigen/teichoic acid export membrane protein
MGDHSLASVTAALGETDAQPEESARAPVAEAAHDFRTSLGFRLVRASGLVAVGNVSSRLLALLTAVVCARLLTEIEFGAFGVVQSALNMFAIAASLNLGVGATRYVALYRAADVNRARAVARVLLSAGAACSVLTAGLMIWSAPWLARVWLGDASVTNPLRLASLQLWAIALYGLAVGVLNGAERFGLSSATSILQNLVILLGSVLLIPRFRTEGAIGAQAFGFASALALGLWYMRDLLRGLSWQTLLKDFRQEGPALAGFSFPVLLGALFIHPFSWMSLAIITRGRDGFKQVAFFTAADRCRLIMLFVTTFVATALFPILSAGHAKGAVDVGAAPRSLELALTGLGIMLLPLGALLAFGGPELMAAFGHSYQVNWSVLLPLVACAGVQAYLNTIGMGLLAHGKQWFALGQQMVYGFVVLTLTYILRRFGGTGLGLAHLITTLIVMAATIPFVRRFKTLSARAGTITVASTLAICLVCLVSWFCPATWRLPLAVPVTTLMLVLSAFFFTNKRERSGLRRLFTQREWSNWRRPDATN